MKGADLMELENNTAQCPEGNADTLLAQIVDGMTPDQQNAVKLKDRNLLVSAAAGSGKTYTLTKRIIKSILIDRKDISRLLVVTFTRASAADLKSKISKAISDAAAKYPEDPHLQEQLLKMGNAHISTIDSFLIEPVKANFEKLGLSSSWRMADDAELASLRDRIMQKTLDHFFKKCDPLANGSLSPVGYRSRYTELIGVITQARESSKILPTFWEIYKKLITAPRALEQLYDNAQRLRENARKDFFETREGQALRQELISEVEMIWRTFKKHSADMQSDPFVASKYTADFDDNAILCHTLLNVIENGNYEQVCEAFKTYKPSDITRIPTKEKTDRSIYYHKQRSDLNTKVKKLATVNLFKSAEELSALFETYAEMCTLIYEILTMFEKEYMAEKRRREVCEFSDIPRFMMRLLMDDDGNLTEYASSLAASYDEVYIDEYQDVNQLQDAIFSIIGKGHRFMVGDIKQSIYGFREAEPQIFTDYRRHFVKYNEKNDVLPATADDGTTVYMSANFRCDKNIIDFANTVCSGVFNTFAESIGYSDDEDKLYFQKKTPEGYVSPKVVIDIIQTPTEDKSEADADSGIDVDDDRESGEDDSSNLSDEAIIVANRIVEILKTKAIEDKERAEKAKNNPQNEEKVKKEEEKKPYVAVLVRKKSHIKPIASALASLGVNYSLPSKSELFEDPDMIYLVNLLSVVDNPRSDLPLFHILTTSTRSCAAVLTVEEAVKVRKSSSSSKSLYDAMIEYGTNGKDEDICSKCEHFVEQIRKIKTNSCKTSADKLIKSLISYPDYSALASTEAYTYVYDSACKFVKNTWSSLYSFIHYFNDLMETGESGSEPGQKNKEDVVIMTAHQSKGLEFKACFLFGFGKQFVGNQASPIIFNKDLGPSMKLPPLPDNEDILKSIRKRSENNPIYQTVNKYIKQKELEEEARIFYVALTRASERLYISATMPGSMTFERYKSKLASCADRDYEIKKSTTYIKWVLMNLPSEDTGIYTVNVHNKGEVSLLPPAEAIIEQTEEKISESDTVFAKLLSSPYKKDDADSNLATIPSKIAASKANVGLIDSIFSDIPESIVGAESDEKDVGTANETLKSLERKIKAFSSSKATFDDLLEINKKPTAAEIGTATHAILQYCKYDNVEKYGLEAEIERLVNDKFITKRTANIVNRNNLKKFFTSDLYAIIRKKKNIYREFHFGMFRDAADFAESEDNKKRVKNKRIFVQGSIDLLIETEDGELIICDYKTDRITKEDISTPNGLENKMKETHGGQLSQYKYAVKQIFGRDVGRTFIYSVPIGVAIEIK